MLSYQQCRTLFEAKGGKLYWRVKGQGVPLSKEITHVDGRGYLKVGYQGKQYAVHRIIYLLCHGDLPDYLDHVDGNRLNNYIDNLRPCNVKQNAWNSKLSDLNTSGVKGVNWSKSMKKWEARIRVGTKRLRLGYYSSIEEAERMIEIKRTELHGNFANNGTGEV